ncbi:MAG: hypothetical protein WCK02_03125 [Bacteroidota bacterium]
MKEYRVDSNNKKVFCLTQNNKLIGELKYNNWFSFKSDITLFNNSKFNIESNDIFGSRMDVKENERLLFCIETDWNNNIIIHASFDEINQEYIFKKFSILNNIYVLLNSDELELLVLRPDFKWKSFNYDYNIVSTENFERLKYKDLMLLTIIHCANYNMSMANTTNFALV